MFSCSTVEAGEGEDWGLQQTTSIAPAFAFTNTIAEGYFVAEAGKSKIHNLRI
jgi:hypothetical protein